MTMDWDKSGDFPAQYEAVNVTAFFRVFAEDLVKRLALSPGERLLDIACGTGIVLRTARAKVADLGRVVGLDLSAAMLAVARDHSGESVELIEGDATQLPFAAGEFDVVTCQQGVQFMPDRSAVLAEMKRVSSGGGRLAVACWRPLEHQPGASAIARAAREIVPDLAGAASAPFSLDRDELTSLVEGAGLTDVVATDVTLDSHYDSAEQLVHGFETGTRLALVIPGLDQAAVAKWHEAAVAELQPFESADGLKLPMTTTLVTATSP